MFQELLYLKHNLSYKHSNSDNFSLLIFINVKLKS